MSAYKNLLAKDVIVTPFTVNKQFSYSGRASTYNESGPFLSDGKNQTYLTGSTTSSLPLVYNSIDQLYYSNYFANNGQVTYLGTRSINLDGDITGPVKVPNYINNIQSINELRYFPTHSGAEISILSIPQKLYGDYIVPGTFNSTTTYDDGEGNLKANNLYGPSAPSGGIVGNIIYGAGLVIHTGYTGSGGYLSFQNFTWQSSYAIYETQYKCTIRANEFNYSLNPSLLTTYGSGSVLLEGKATYKNFVTGSDFSPYVTTIGLYDNNQNLLAVGKLAQPLPTSQTTDTTILINLDR